MMEEGQAHSHIKRQEPRHEHPKPNQERLGQRKERLGQSEGCPAQGGECLGPITRSMTNDGNQVEDAQAHEAQAQQGAQAQQITRSMARALGQEYQKMTLLISIV